MKLSANETSSDFDHHTFRKGKGIMSSAISYDSDPGYYDELDPFQKIRRHPEGRMPVGRARAARRASHRTAPSRQASKRVSQTASGKHHRRIRTVDKVNWRAMANG
jgi:hypothetical protein